MPASFLHGIEVIEVDSGPVPVTVVKSAVIGLVGTAPSWAVEAPAVAPAVNAPTLVSSALDGAKFGPSGSRLYYPVCAGGDSESGRGAGDRHQRI